MLNEMGGEGEECGGRASQNRGREQYIEGLVQDCGISIGSNI